MTVTTHTRAAWTGEAATRVTVTREDCGCVTTVEEPIIDLGQGDTIEQPCREHMDPDERAELEAWEAANPPAPPGPEQAHDPWALSPF